VKQPYRSPAPKPKRVHKPESNPDLTPRMAMDRLATLHALETARAICDRAGVDIGDALGRSNHPSATLARRCIWTTLRHTLGLSYPEIARVFGRDHSTVMSGIRQREAELAAMYSSDGGESWAAQ